MSRYHKKRWQDSPVTIEELVAEGKTTHGREVWLEQPDDVSTCRERVVFDFEGREFVSQPVFNSREKERAKSRRGCYPNGRRHGRQALAFVSHPSL